MATKKRQQAEHDFGPVRRDIFSVKADERDLGGWCHVYMTYSRAKAYRRAREIRNNTTLGLNRLAKVVHPRALVVRAYIVAGNDVDD